MTDEELVDFVARAIAAADPEQEGQIDGGEMGEYFWEKYGDRYLAMAVAAIRAMRAAD